MAEKKMIKLTTCTGRPAVISVDHIACIFHDKDGLAHIDLGGHEDNVIATKSKFDDVVKTFHSFGIVDIIDIEKGQ